MILLKKIHVVYWPAMFYQDLHPPEMEQMNQLKKEIEYFSHLKQKDSTILGELYLEYMQLEEEVQTLKDKIYGKYEAPTRMHHSRAHEHLEAYAKLQILQGELQALYGDSKKWMDMASKIRERNEVEYKSLLMTIVEPRRATNLGLLFA